jgi:universal stress protein A
MPGYSHLLLAVDFYAKADAVANRAAELSRAFGAKLSLIHVVEYVPVDLSSELVPPQMPDIDQELITVAQQRLGELSSRLDLDDCPCIVVQGNTRREILRVAEENEVDLIVIGSHGRQGIQRLLGSTANAVLHGAPCDVLAVRVKD